MGVSQVRPFINADIAAIVSFAMVSVSKTKKYDIIIPPFKHKLL